jgi:hypothetical protein
MWQIFIVPHVMIQNNLKWTVWIFFNIKKKWKYSKLLPYVNASFVISLNQIIHMLITKENRYKNSQCMKKKLLIFVFHPKIMSFVIVVACDLLNMTNGIYQYFACD